MGHAPPASTPEFFERTRVTHNALIFTLGAALLLGGFLTFVGGTVLADSRRWASDLGMSHADLLTSAMSLGVFGLLTFIAAVCAILGTIGAA